MNRINIDDHKLGRYLARRAGIPVETIERALQIQHDLPFLRLGEILLGFHAISFKDLIEALYSQFSEAMLGNILVRHGVLTEEQVGVALEQQALEPQPRRLGEMLVAQGKARQEQVDAALHELDLYNDYKIRLGSSRYFDEAFAALKSRGPASGSSGGSFWDREASLLMSEATALDESP